MTDMEKIRADRGDVNPGRVRHMDQVRAVQEQAKRLRIQVALNLMDPHDPARPGLKVTLAELDVTLAKLEAVLETKSKET